MSRHAKSATVALVVTAPWVAIFAVVRWWDVAAPIVWAAVVLTVGAVMARSHQYRTGRTWTVEDPDRDHRTPPLHLFDPSSPDDANQGDTA